METIVIDGVEYKLCKRGHPRTPENLDNQGKCKLCRVVRSRGKGHLSWAERKKTHCKRGHERTPENVGSNGACKLCKALDTQKRYESDKDAWNSACRKWVHNNIGKRRETVRRDNKRKSVNLTNDYVARELGISVKTAPPELIEIKRNQILFKRALKELKQTLKG